MSDSLIKRAAMERLAANLDAYLASVPEGAPLVGKVLVGEAEQGDDAQYSSLRVLYDRFEFERHQDDVVEQVGADKHLVRVGELTGKVRLRLSATTDAERERLEQPVLAAFFQEQDAGGRIIELLPALTLNGKVTLHEAAIAFDVESEDWDSEKVFADRLRSDLELEATMPVLVLRTGYSDKQLVLATEAAVGLDINQEADPRQFEELELREDGTLDPY